MWPKFRIALGDSFVSARPPRLEASLLQTDRSSSERQVFFRTTSLPRNDSSSSERKVSRQENSSSRKGWASMRKIGSLGLTIGASIVAVSAATFILLVSAHDTSGLSAEEVARAGGASVPDRPDWNWDVRPILSENCFSCHGQSVQKAGL